MSYDPRRVSYVPQRFCKAWVIRHAFSQLLQFIPALRWFIGISPTGPTIQRLDAVSYDPRNHAKIVLYDPRNRTQAVSNDP